MISIRPFAAVLTVTALLAACSAGPKLSERPSSPVDLSGSWLMDVERSDDVEAMLRDAMAQGQRKAKQEKRSRPPRQAGGERERGRKPEGGSRAAAAGAADQRDDGMAMIKPDELVFADRRMEIKQSPFLVEVTSKRAGYRRYKIGAPISRTGPGGTFEINSGWNGQSFYAVSEGRQGIDIVEKYSLSEDGLELTRKLTMEAKFLDDKLEVTQFYYPEPDDS